MAYFDLYRELRVQGSGPKGLGAGRTIRANLWLVLQYFALVVGIIAKRFLDVYQTGNLVFQVSIPLIVFSLIVGAAVFPAVFRKTFDAKDPRLIQLFITFTSGLGYQALFQAAVKAVS